MKRFPLAVGVALLLLGCRTDAVSPSSRGPTFAVSDGAHDGNPDFFFLPPLFKHPSTHTDFDAGQFNASLRPAVEICQLGEPAFPGGPRECVGLPVKRFEPSAVTVSEIDEQYQANWHTDETNLDVTKFYRVIVLVGTERLGFADIDPVTSGKDLKSVETGEYIGLVDGRTLPIKFRIENRALCGTPESPCAAETINLQTGGGITLPTETETFVLDVPPNTQATYGGQPVTDVTFSLETCDDIDVDLTLFGDCLRVTTFFEVAGAAGAELVLTNAAKISLCVLDPGLEDHEQQHLITLHQQDGTLIQALPHVSPNCDVITSRPSGIWDLAGRGWRWARALAARLVMPKELYARAALRRNAVFNLGGGGETDRFGSSCSGAASAPVLGPTRIMLVDCPPPSGPALAATATRAGTRTSSDFQFALPAMMDYVLPADADRTAAPGSLLPTAVKITDWHGSAVQGATITFTEPGIEGPGIVIGTAVSNSDGIAAIEWLIEEGPNTVVASGRGIAGPNNYPEAQVRPFMPDISSETPQSAVALGTGRLPFSATGQRPVGSVQFLQQPTNTVSGEAISPGLRIQLLDPAGAPITEIVRVTVGNDPDNPETCQVLQVSTLAIEGVAQLDNVIVNGTCTGARVGVAAGATEDFDFPIIFSDPFDILPAAPTGLDQQNLLDGSIGGQGIGRFNDIDGTPDPDGTSFDFQDAQTFTVGVSGRLSQIKVPLVNNSEATVGVTMQIVAVVDGVPDEGQSFGEVTIPASAIPTEFETIGNAALWPVFDLTGLEIEVDAGQMLAFIVRSLSTSAYIFNPEFTSGYANGAGFRRNRALTASWSNSEADFGFQTFVDQGP